MALFTREFRTRQLWRVADSPLVLRLFTNDLAPTGEETLAAFTEPTGGGYAPIPLDPGQWRVIAEPNPTASYPRTVFLFTGKVGDVHGFFVTQEGLVAYAERFPAPYEILRDGEDIKVSWTVQG